MIQNFEVSCTYSSMIHWVPEHASNQQSCYMVSPACLADVFIMFDRSFLTGNRVARINRCLDWRWLCWVNLFSRIACQAWSKMTCISKGEWNSKRVSWRWQEYLKAHDVVARPGSKTAKPLFATGWPEAMSHILKRCGRSIQTSLLLIWGQ